MIAPPARRLGVVRPLSAVARDSGKRGTKGGRLEIRVLGDILTQLERHHRSDLFRYKSAGAWHDISTQDFFSTVRSLALGLETLGVVKGERVAILSENRPEWTAFDHALLSLGAVVVPIYASLLTEQVRFILENSQAHAVVVSGVAQLEKLRPALPSLPDLSRVIILDAGQTPPGDAVSWTSVLAAGEAAQRAEPQRFEARRSAIRPEDPASILYTSGTTGEPKGVVLTHGNFAFNVNATLKLIPFSSDDATLSFLPLTHVFERMVEFAYLSAGASIAYAESIEAVPQNMAEVRPTVVSSVPRFFEKAHDRIVSKLRSLPWPRRLLVGLLLRAARRRARALLEKRPAPPVARLLHPLTDRLVFAPLREKMGGRIRFFISGSAPLEPRIAEFFYAAGITILEGYGLTETAPVVAVNTLERTRLGTVGPVIPGVEVRIAEDGEILVRGPNVMQGYFRNEAATREAMQDGWFHTGDIGVVDSDGFLKITDRKKELLKTSGGKMVAPQPLENLLKSDRAISQAVVLGDRRKFVSALIVPDFDWLASFARHKQISTKNVDELLRDPRVLDLYRARVRSKMAGLPSYETVKKFRLLPRELSQEAGELTPTLKVKRRVVEKKYADLIESIYKE
jgi:long-chain acyl-CoA synthetase